VQHHCIAATYQGETASAATYAKATVEAGAELAGFWLLRTMISGWSALAAGDVTVPHMPTNWGGRGQRS